MNKKYILSLGPRREDGLRALFVERPYSIRTGDSQHSQRQTVALLNNYNALLLEKAIEEIRQEGDGDSAIDANGIVRAAQEEMARRAAHEAANRIRKLAGLPPLLPILPRSPVNGSNIGF